MVALAEAFVKLRPTNDKREFIKAGKDTGKLFGEEAGKALVDGIQKALTGQGDKIGKKVADEFAKAFTDNVKRQTKDVPLGPSKPRTQRQGKESAGTFAESFRKQLETASRSLPPLNVGVAKTQAEQAIRDVQAELRKLSSQTVGVDIDAADALIEIRHLESQLQELGRTSPDIQVQADTASAAAALEKVRLEAERLAGKSPKVTVDVDTDKATRKVGAFRTIVNDAISKLFSSGSNQGSAFFQAISEAAVRSAAQVASSLFGVAVSAGATTAATGGLNVVLGALSAVLITAVGATLGLVAGFTALAPILLTVGGLLGASVTALFGVAAGAATLILGIKGIGSAYEALNAVQDEAEASAGSNAAAQKAAAGAVVSAQEQIRSALAAQANTRASLAEAARRAALQVADADRAVGKARQEAAQQLQEASQRIADATQRARDAQRSLTDAERDALDIRKELTSAQRAAREQLEDLASNVKGNALDQRQAVLDVADAKARLDAVLGNKKATQAQRDAAQIAYERQVQEFEDLKTRGRRLAAEKAEADKKGIEGSDQVTNARERIAAAEQRIIDARRQANEADREIGKAQKARDQQRLEGLDRIRTAERAASEARRAQQEQQRTGAYQLSQASNAVAAAQRALGQASERGATQATAAMIKLKQELDALSPAGRELVSTFNDLKTPFGELKKFVQQRLLDGVAGQVRDLSQKWLTPLRTILGDLADRFNKVGDGLFKAFGRKDFIDNITIAVRGFGDFIQRIGESLPGFIDALGRVGKASVPVLKRLGELVGGILDDFSAWIKTADDTGKLDTFMQDAADTLGQIFRITGLVIDIFGELFETLFPQSKETSDGFLGGVEDSLKRIRDYLADPKNQQKIRDWISDVKEFIRKVGEEWIPKVSEWIDRLDRWVTGFENAVESVRGAARAIVGIFVGAGNSIRGVWAALRDGVFKPISDFISKLIPGAFSSGRDKISAFFGQTRDKLSSIGTSIRGSLEKVRAFIGITLPGAFNLGGTRSSNAFTLMRDRLSNTWGSIRDRIFNPLRAAISASVPDSFKRGADAIKLAWDKVKEAARTPVAFVVNKVVNPFIGGINKVGKIVGVKEAIEPIKGFARGGLINGPNPGPGKDNMLASITGSGRPITVAGKEFITNAQSTMANLPLVKAINAKRGKVSHADVDPYLDGGAGDGIGDVWDSIVRGAKRAASVIADPSAALKGAANTALGLVPGTGMLRDSAIGATKRLVSSVIGFIKGKLGAGSDAGNLGGDSVLGGWKGMQRLIAGRFPELKLISGFRPGSVTLTGNRSYHSIGRAVDYPPVRALASWIRSTFGSKTKELITPWQELNLHNGRPHTYTGAVWNQHNFAGGNAHVHWAAALGGLVDKMRSGMPVKVFDSGGAWPDGTIGVNTSGRTEYVDPNRSRSSMGDVVDLLEQMIQILSGLGYDIAEAQRTGIRRTARSARAGARFA